MISMLFLRNNNFYLRIKIKLVIYLFFFSLGISLFFFIFFYSNYFSEKELNEIDVINSSYYWKQQKDIFSLHSVENKILFLGSSIFDDVELNELFERNDIVNRGIGGDITYGVLNRIDDYLVDSPKCIFLKIGVNDFFWGFHIDSVKLNYVKIVDKIAYKNIPLFIISTNQTSDKFKNSEKINKQVKQLNLFLSQLTSCSNVVFVDINKDLTNEDGLKNEFTPDGIHLNHKGYLVFKKSIQPYILFCN
jgi:lysophospholipase L1-like esterase